MSSFWVSLTPVSVDFNYFRLSLFWNKRAYQKIEEKLIFLKSWHYLSLNTLCGANKPWRAYHVFWITFASSCEYSNWCAIQPIAIQDVITSPPSPLFITASLSEVPARVADSRRTPAHPSSSGKCTVLAQTWIHSWVTLDYELECDWGCSFGFLTLALGLLNCCRATDGCNVSTAGMRLTRCSTSSKCLRGGVAQYLTWGLGIIVSYSFSLPCTSDPSWCPWYFSIKESGFSWGQQARFFSLCSRFIWISQFLWMPVKLFRILPKI